MIFCEGFEGYFKKVNSFTFLKIQALEEEVRHVSQARRMMGEKESLTAHVMFKQVFSACFLFLLARHLDIHLFSCYSVQVKYSWRLSSNGRTSVCGTENLGSIPSSRPKKKSAYFMF